MNDNIDEKDLNDIDNKDIDIQPRADWVNMIFADYNRDNNDANKFYEDMVWYKTISSTKNLPSSLPQFRDESNVGMLITCRDGWKTGKLHGNANINATQYFFPGVKGFGSPHTGKIYVRFGLNVGRATWVASSGKWQNELTQWDVWQEIKGAKGEKGDRGEQGPPGPISSGAGLIDVYRHINDDSVRGNPDNYKSLGSKKTENITGIPNNHGQGYGTIIYIPEHYDNIGQTHKGFQIFSSTSHNAMYYRSSNVNGDWQQWRRIDSSLVRPESQSDFNGSGSNLNTINETSLYRTGGNPTNVPVGSSEGVLFTLKGGRDDKVQTWYGTSNQGVGKIFARWNNDSNWKRISTDDRVVLNPDSEGVIQDVNNINKSGIFKTRHEDNNLPSGVDNRNGIIQHYKKDNDSATQIFTVIHGTQKNRLYHRTKENGIWQGWKQIATIGDIPSTFEHHQSIPSNDIKRITKSGYYFTTENTIGLPDGIDGENKKGTLKVLFNNSNDRVFEFTPFKGTKKGKWIGHIDTTLRNTNPHWEQLRGNNGHLRVADDRGVSAITPRQYWEHTETGEIEEALGYVWYEWRFVNALGGTIPPEVNTSRCTVKTVVPYGKGIDPEHSQDHDWSDIHQIITTNNGKVFYRTAKSGTEWNDFISLTGGVDSSAWLKPESQNVAENIDDIPSSSTMRIANTTKGTWSGTDEQGYSQKKGFIQTVYCKSTTTGLQTLIRFHDTENEYKVYKRHRNAGKGWSGWNEVGGTSPTEVTRDKVRAWIEEYLKELFEAWKQKHII